MHSSLTIEINDSNEAYVEAAVIKARRRKAHICLAIQQIGMFLAACFIVSSVVWHLWSTDKHADINIMETVIIILAVVASFTLASDLSYEYYQHGGQHDHEYDISCGNHVSLRTPWFIKWLIRKGKKLFKS